MTTLTPFNLDEPPPKTNKPPSQSSSLFSSLPDDIVLDILARIPKRDYPILSCVSKRFQILVRSPEIHKLRSLLGKESLYISFYNETSHSRQWFTLRRMEKNQNENILASVDFSSLPKINFSSIIAVGPEIFFISIAGSVLIFDSRFGKSRQGQEVQLERIKTAGLVGGKMYVTGLKGKKIHAEFFDLKTQTWKQAPIPQEEKTSTWNAQGTFVLNRKVCAISRNYIACYDTKNGYCERIEFPKYGYPRGVCVIDNVLYVYYAHLGLKWYDYKLKKWKIVNGLDHLNMIYQIIGMEEYYGKLAYMWTEPDGIATRDEPDGCEKKHIWCRVIALDKGEKGINGTVESSQLLGFVPRGYTLRECLSLSD